MAEFLYTPLKTKLSRLLKRREKRQMDALARAAGHNPDTIQSMGSTTLSGNVVIMIPKEEQSEEIT